MRRRLIPAPWPVLHTSRAVSDQFRDEHGNDITVAADPVVRYVISYFQYEYKGPLSSNRVYTVEYLNETVTSLHMVIPAEDLSFYRSGDQVVIKGSLGAGGAYSGGEAFLVDGEVASDLQGPWPHLYRHFGGLVKIKRIGASTTY